MRSSLPDCMQAYCSDLCLEGLRKTTEACNRIAALRSESFKRGTHRKRGRRAIRFRIWWSNSLSPTSNASVNIQELRHPESLYHAVKQTSSVSLTTTIVICQCSGHNNASLQGTRFENLDWIHMAQARVQGRVLSYKAMNFLSVNGARLYWLSDCWLFKNSLAYQLISHSSDQNLLYFQVIQFKLSKRD